MEQKWKRKQSAGSAATALFGGIATLATNEFTIFSWKRKRKCRSGSGTKIHHFRFPGDAGYESVKAIVLSISGVNDPAKRLCALAKR